MLLLHALFGEEKECKRRNHDQSADQRNYGKTFHLNCLLGFHLTASHQIWMTSLLLHRVQLVHEDEVRSCPQRRRNQSMRRRRQDDTECLLLPGGEVRPVDSG